VVSQPAFSVTRNSDRHLPNFDLEEYKTSFATTRARQSRRPPAHHGSFFGPTGVRDRPVWKRITGIQSCATLSPKKSRPIVISDPLSSGSRHTRRVMSSRTSQVAPIDHITQVIGGAERHEPSRPAPVCPICERQRMTFGCTVTQLEIYGCTHCGATLTVPADAKSRAAGLSAAVASRKHRDRT
jgi:hypothetical protein